MKKLLKPVLTIVFFSLVLATVYYKSNSSNAQSVGEDVLKTPVVSSPQVPSIVKYQSTLLKSYAAESDWKAGDYFGTSTEPLIAGDSAVLIDLKTSKVLYEKDSTKKMKIASLTKIMTAILVLEHKKLTDKIYIDDDATSVGENSMNLSTGEVYSVEELLYGLVLQSGNDAAYALAKGTGGTVNTFVDWMNFKAKELGLTNTFFADPSGLNDDTYSTAEDLAKLTRYALKFPEFKDIVKTVEKELISDDHKYILLENQTNLLTTYPGVAGVKTGYTEEAGLCLVTYAANDGREVVGVVLKSIDRKGDMILMLDHGFSTLGVKVEHNLLDY